MIVEIAGVFLCIALLLSIGLDLCHEKRIISVTVEEMCY